MRNLASHRGGRRIPVLATFRPSGSAAEPDPDGAFPFQRHFGPPTAPRSLNPVLRRLKCRKSCNSLSQTISAFVNMQVSEFSDVRGFNDFFSFATFPTFSPGNCNISDTLRRWRWLLSSTAKQRGRTVSSGSVVEQYGQAVQPGSTAKQHKPGNGKGPAHECVGPQPAVV